MPRKSVSPPPPPSWTLSYGWRAVTHQGGKPTGQDLSARPPRVETLSFHSLESALHYPELGTWQEIRDPAGVVIMVTGKGFIEEACPNPSLCAKQILNIRYPGVFPDAMMDDVLDSADMVSHDDGKTWSRILLGTKVPSTGNGNKIDSKSASRLDNLRISAGPEEGKVEIRYGGYRQDGAEIFTAYNPPPKGQPAGRAVVLRSALTIRKSQAKSDKQAPSYDLVIRKPDEKRTRIYAANIDPAVVEAGRRLGIAVEEPLVRTDGLSKAWKPGLFTIECKEEEEGKPGTTKEVRGFIRGSLAIDRRMVDQKGYGDTTWKVLRWCLTHIPTGSRIVTCKARKTVEEIADGLREVVPELTDGDAIVTEEIKKKGREVLAQFGIKTPGAEDKLAAATSADRERIFRVPDLEGGAPIHPVHITGSTPTAGPVLDPDRRFYVSVVDGVSKPRYGFLIGPFKLHQTALPLVDAVRILVQEKYPLSHFYSFGTCSLPKESAFEIPGRLNDEEGFREIYVKAFLTENRT